MKVLPVRLSLAGSFAVLVGACGSSGGSETLFSDGFDTYPSSNWVQVSSAAPTLDLAVGNPAPSLALGSADTYLQTALVGPFNTRGATFSLDVSVDSIASGGRACINLFVQGNESINFGLDLETNGGKFFDGLGGGCTPNNPGGLIAMATPGFHTLALEFDDSGATTATFDGSQIGKASFPEDAVVMEIDGQGVHLDNARITTN